MTPEEQVIADLKARIEKSERATKEANKKSAIASTLSRFNFANEASRDVVVCKLSVDCFDSNGDLTLTSISLDDFANDIVSKCPNLIASSGTPAQGRGGQPVPTLDDIKPGLTSDEYERIYRHIQSLT